MTDPRDEQHAALYAQVRAHWDDPTMPWTHTHADDQLYRTAADAPSALQTLRHHLRTMATEPAPEPTVPEPGA